MLYGYVFITTPWAMEQTMGYIRKIPVPLTVLTSIGVHSITTCGVRKKPLGEYWSHSVRQ